MIAFVLKKARHGRELIEQNDCSEKRRTRDFDFARIKDCVTVFCILYFVYKIQREKATGKY